MAIDQTQKALNLARSIRNEAQNLMAAHKRLKALKDSKESAGLDFLAYDAEFATQDDLKHLDGSILNNVLSSTTALDTFLTTNFHDDNYEQAALNV